MADEEVRIVTETVSVRRTPKYGRFIILGAALGAIITFVLTNLFPVDPDVGFFSLFAYFALFGVTIGAAIGAIIAIVFDRVMGRRRKEVAAERTIVEEGTIDGELLPNDTVV
jgi:MFS family permease